MHINNTFALSLGYGVMLEAYFAEKTIIKYIK